MVSLPRSGALPPEHAVPDLLAPGLALVFCGTALGRVSAERRAYYANPGNFFWRTLHRAGFTPHRLAPADYRQLLDHGIGLTDLCKAHFGNDAQLPPGALDAEALRRKLAYYRPGIVAFTSKTGASAYLGRATGSIAYGFQPGPERVFVLPSPSGQARVFWDEAPWHALAEAIGRR